MGLDRRGSFESRTSLNHDSNHTRHDGESVATGFEEKQGALCCGCFCDYRTAVIVMESLAICCSVVPIVMSARESPYDDERGFDRIDVANVTVVMLNVVAAAVGLLGAMLFAHRMIAVVVAWDLIMIGYLIYGLIEFTEDDFLRFVVNEGGAAFYTTYYYGYTIVFQVYRLYPSVSFVRELRAGIMHRETYHRREKKCCCSTV